MPFFVIPLSHCSCWGPPTNSATEPWDDFRNKTRAGTLLFGPWRAGSRLHRIWDKTVDGSHLMEMIHSAGMPWAEIPGTI